MVKCIAPGCKSDSRSNRKCAERNKKIHFFTVPKDENVTKLWQEAIMQKNFTVKAGQYVCDKHFNREDILHEKILRAPDGTILGRSPYQIARLRKGALPSLFPGRPSYSSNPAPKQRELPVKQESESFGNSTTKISKGKNINDIVESCDVSLENEENTRDSSINLTQHRPECIFASIFEHKTEISVPTSWSWQNISCNSIRAIQFTEWIVRKNGNDVESVCTKQVLVEENLTFHINIMGRRIKAEDFGFENNAAFTAQDLENIIKKVDNYQICSGCAEINADENIITSFACYKEGYLHHKLCPFLLPKDNKDDLNIKSKDKCKLYVHVMHKLNQKLLRIQKGKNGQ